MPQNPTLTYFSMPTQRAISAGLAQHEYHQRKRQHTEYAHHRGMAMVGCQLGADFIVADDRQVDEEAEDAGADEVPEAHGHQEVERPFMRYCYLFTADVAVSTCGAHEIPCVQGQQCQRHHFQYRDHSRQCHVDAALASKIPVMAGADQATGEIQDGIEVNHSKRDVALGKTQLIKQQRHHRGCEEFKETFDP